jgi:hypothetical protein
MVPLQIRGQMGAGAGGLFVARALFRSGVPSKPLIPWIQRGEQPCGLVGAVQYNKSICSGLHRPRCESTSRRRRAQIRQWPEHRANMRDFRSVTAASRRLTSGISGVTSGGAPQSGDAALCALIPARRA